MQRTIHYRKIMTDSGRDETNVKGVHIDETEEIPVLREKEHARGKSTTKVVVVQA